MECADSMTEAIKKLLTNEYICVGINADAIDFMPLLSTMRSVTNIPILIATGNFSTEKEVAALNSGADLYARWHESPEDNVSSVLSHIARKTARNATPRKIIAYRNLIIAPAQRYAFIDNEPLELTRHEFDFCRLYCTYQCLTDHSNYCPKSGLFWHYVFLFCYPVLLFCHPERNEEFYAQSGIL